VRHRTSTSSAGYAAGAASTLFWGLSFVGVRVALEGFAPFGLVGLRLAIAAVLLAGWLAWRGGGLRPTAGDGRRAALLGLILAVHLVIQTIAMRETTAIRAGWFVAFMPVVIGVGAMVFLGERMRAWGWGGVALASGGVLLLAAARPADLARVGLGDALLFASCFTWAAYTLIAGPVVRRNGSLKVTTWAMLAAAPPCLVLAAWQGFTVEHPSSRAWTALVLLGVLASGAAFLAFGRAVAILGAQRTSAFLYVQPFVTLCGSRVFLDEPFTLGGLVGGLIVLVGVWIIQRAKSGMV
ncbi:MAG TPA: DMT family transporter, partial [Planctomycetota bacterium]|nr:DMT family transporter [Planctomycetota bacterium]